MGRILNWALIGAGGMGGAHLHTLQTLEAEGKVRLACVADPFAERLADTRAELERKGVRWHADYQEMLAKEEVLDAVSICTPIHLHERMAKAALARGLFVYLEKPPVPLIQQLDALVQLDTQRKIAVGFQMIGSRFVRQLKRWKTEGALGDVSAIRVSVAWPRMTQYYQRASWAGRMTLNGEPVFDGPATNANSHLVHTIMFLAGDKMDEFASPTDLEAELYRARPIPSYDTACMRGKLTTGVEFTCTVTHATEKMVPFRIELIGSKGKAWMSDNGQSMENDAGLQNPEPPDRDSFLASYQGFIAYVQGARARAYSHLADTRGYVLATNGALLSSGGVHSISAEHWRTYGQGDDSGYDVRGLTGWIEQSGQTGKLFSELNVPWAKKGNRISLGDLRSIKLD